MTYQPRLIANRFQVGEIIGGGGMGQIFRGLDLQTQEPVAIKVLRAEYTAHAPEMVERFIREGAALRVCVQGVKQGSS
jgi:serine/threonine-protein kinase